MFGVSSLAWELNRHKIECKNMKIMEILFLNVHKSLHNIMKTQSSGKPGCSYTHWNNEGSGGTGTETYGAAEGEENLTKSESSRNSLVLDSRSLVVSMFVSSWDGGHFSHGSSISCFQGEKWRSEYTSYTFSLSSVFNSMWFPCQSGIFWGAICSHP